jgi:hypothetical protein
MNDLRTNTLIGRRSILNEVVLVSYSCLIGIAMFLWVTKVEGTIVFFATPGPQMARIEALPKLIVKPPEAVYRIEVEGFTGCGSE